MTRSKELKTVNKRLKYWRNSVRLSQGEFLTTLRPHLPKDEQFSVSMVSYYENSIEPRASFLAALKKAYPDLNLNWLLTGEEQASISEEQRSAITKHVPGLSDAATEALGSLLQATEGTDKLHAELPPKAFDALTQFLREVRQSSGSYQALKSQEWKQFVRRLTKLILSPLESEPHFVGSNRLTSSEITTFVYAMLAALRPLVASLRTEAMDGFLRRLAEPGR